MCELSGLLEQAVKWHLCQLKIAENFVKYFYTMCFNSKALFCICLFVCLLLQLQSAENHACSSFPRP